MTDGVAAVTRWLRACADEFDARREELDALDRLLGDGDHGTNMCRGFIAAQTLDLSELVTGAEALRQVGMALVSNVGGASGPLFGTYLLRIGAVWPLHPTTRAVAMATRQGLDGVMARGKASVGDKTMVDAIAPAADSLDLSARDGEDLAVALEKAADAAEAGALATVGMAARRGRAHLLAGESVGVIDPGAVSVGIIARIAAQSLS
ncbi:dihydroxyacetone kinase, C-terminal domain [Tessaracoccus bendigoensis DSM 12906]|uniref:Dihydroxyacetone kinase, C-terminal domain n=1 Tax=Tessaracoccus bendigoensis DSM 12906 TaxID=1123357 RepID=A0A1M6DX90_9ACTN|nr:dihydroxyacetone kinase subunit DhaL [Tessaracoccus bendigoensis]SHI77897.1 dihydroxyacetone kinase, C-terminal domain [Tessaracoccus bendigoensis DSM 12906]